MFSRRLGRPIKVKLNEFGIDIWLLTCISTQATLPLWFVILWKCLVRSASHDLRHLTLRKLSKMRIRRRYCPLRHQYMYNKKQRRIFFHKRRQLPVRHNRKNVVLLLQTTIQDRRTDEGDENVENCLTPVIPRVTSRKRYAQPQTWKRNILKKARQTGTQVSVDDTTTLEKKVNLGDLCNDNCRYRCNATLTEGNRRRIFQEYYEKCVTVNEKNQFIRTGIERNVPQRHKSDPTTHSRDNSYHYFLMVSTMSYMQIFWLFWPSLSLIGISIQSCTCKWPVWTCRIGILIVYSL